MSPAAMSTGSVAAAAGGAPTAALTRSCAVAKLPRQAATATARPARANGIRTHLRSWWTYRALAGRADGLVDRCMQLSPPGFKSGFEALAPDGTRLAGSGAEKSARPSRPTHRAVLLRTLGADRTVLKLLFVNAARVPVPVISLIASNRDTHRYDPAEPTRIQPDSSRQGKVRRSRQPTSSRFQRG
jgi:hypothetical protein